MKKKIKERRYIRKKNKQSKAIPKEKGVERRKGKRTRRERDRETKGPGEGGGAEVLYP